MSLEETVFLDLENTRYKWDDTGNGNFKISTTPIEASSFAIGIVSEKLALKLELNIKVLFLDLGNTLVSRPNASDNGVNASEKFVSFPETDTILSNLKARGLEMGIISDGSTSQLETLLADPTLLDRFKVVVMSDDEEVGGVRKPKARIFNVALTKMSNALGFDLNPSETALLTETIEHFKVYNFIYTLGLNKIMAHDCDAYITQQ